MNIIQTLLPKMDEIYILKWISNDVNTGRWLGGDHDDYGPNCVVAASHDIKKLEDMMEEEIRTMIEDEELPINHEKEFVPGEHMYSFTMYNEDGKAYGCELRIEKHILV